MKIKNITKITKLENKYTLYDLETETSNFFANNILVHNSNMACCYSKPDGMWFQSRNNIVEASPTAKYLKEEPWLEIIKTLADEYSINLNKNVIVVSFEHCGGSIQKLSAVSGLSKRAVIFAYFKVSPIEPYEEMELGKVKPGRSFQSKEWKGQQFTATPWVGNLEPSQMICNETVFTDKSQVVKVLTEESSVWYPTKFNQVLKPDYTFGMPNYTNVADELFDIYNIRDFPTVEVEIDFNKPEEAQNKIVELTLEVESNSGVAKYFDKPDNTGEGWVFQFKDVEGTLLTFKSKGEAHAKNAGKVKILRPVDEVKEQKKRDFVNDNAMQSFRLNQAWEEVFGVNNEKNEPNEKFTGDIIRFMLQDTIREESDVLIDLGLEDRDVKGLIASQTRLWFLDRLNNGELNE